MQTFRAVPHSVGMYVPEKVWTNDDLSKMMTTSDDWIQSRSGIKQRHIAEAEDSTSALGMKAAKVCLEAGDTSPEEVDLILAATLSPDYYFPGIGVQIQDLLGCKQIPAIDIRGQCAGFCWSLAAAQGFAATGQYKKILVVGAELHSKVINWDDTVRDIAILFGDGAGAMLLNVEPDFATVDNNKSGLIDHIMGSDGSEANSLAMARPGMAKGHSRFVTEADLSEFTCHPTMDGRSVFKHAVSKMCESVESLLERNRLQMDDIALVVPHQANARIIEAIAKKLDLPGDKVVNVIANYGNTTAATVPIALDHAVRAGSIKKGDLIVTVAFGSGFAWGANLMRW